ncbi:MAG: hypothetical protein CFE43_04100 [Burkholderiales bacterium PBB3]|nr:MAG: hypothetical protein CFE43_04100 [Burkholderiales bacterium PBB3]
MSLITRCPACTTLFKVVPDQLRVSEGWVRCGKCDEVFDANVHLQGEPQALAPRPTEALVVPTAPVPNDEPVAEPDAGTPTSPEFFEHPEPAPALGSTPEQELAAQLDWPEASAFDRDPLLDVRPGESLAAEPALHLELPGDGVAPEADAYPLVATDAGVEWSLPGAHGASAVREPPNAAKSAAEIASVADEQEPELPVPPLDTVRPSFLRNAKLPSAWSRPWVRRSLAAVSLGLVLGLAFQVIFHERERLAASIADLRPALLAMCDALDCKISPYRQIDSVVIENSAFVKVRGDVYRLNITLKNTAPIDIAAPAVELTLTDLQEQPMIRHVLSAADLGASSGSLVAGGDLTVTIPVHVKVATPADRISGYRLLAFYP